MGNSVAPGAGASTRVFACSDLHVDHKVRFPILYLLYTFLFFIYFDYLMPCPRGRAFAHSSRRA